MRHCTTEYRLISGDEVKTFLSEKEACDYLSVSKCSVASCYRRGTKCKGYKVERIGITTHHATGTRLFKIWGSMLERCNRKKHPQYMNYGGRGISVCDQWNGMQGFYNFREWALENGYDETLTIDRINVNGDYSPENCRWATVKEQMNNKRNNHLVNANGEVMTATQCSELYGIPKSTVRWRSEHGRNVVTGARMDGGVNDAAD